MKKYGYIPVIIIVFLFTACRQAAEGPADSTEGFVSSAAAVETEAHSSASDEDEYTQTEAYAAAVTETPSVPETLLSGETESFSASEADWFRTGVKHAGINDISAITALELAVEEGKLMASVSAGSRYTFTVGDCTVLDLEPLAACSALSKLELTDLDALGVTTVGWESLTSLPLEFIDCINCGLEEFPISGEDGAFKDLISLDLPGNHIADLSGISLPAKIRFIDLNGNPVTDLSPFIPYIDRLTVDFDGAELTSPSISPVQAQKYVLEYFAENNPPFFYGDEEYVPDFNEKNYTFNSARLCCTHPPGSTHFRHYYNSIDYCVEPRLAWMLSYTFDWTGSFDVWVDAEYGYVLMYGDVLPD